MSEDKVLTRREFTVESALAMLATVAITITGCGDDSPPTTPTPPATDKTGTVTTDNDHTHPSVTDHGGPVHGRKRGYTDPREWHDNPHTHGSPVSRRTHANQRGNACAEAVDDRQQPRTHGDVQLTHGPGSGVSRLRQCENGLAGGDSRNEMKPGCRRANG